MASRCLISYGLCDSWLVPSLDCSFTRSCPQGLPSQFTVEFDKFLQPESWCLTPSVFHVFVRNVPSYFHIKTEPRTAFNIDINGPPTLPSACHGGLKIFASRQTDFLIAGNESPDVSASVLCETLKAYIRGQIISYAG